MATRWTALPLHTFPVEFTSLLRNVDAALHNVDQCAQTFRYTVELFEHVFSISLENDKHIHEMKLASGNVKGHERAELHQRITAAVVHGRRLSSWCFIPARDGVMTLNQMRLHMEQVSSLSRNCPQLREQIDLDRAKAARKAFRENFQGVDHLRNAVAHQEAYTKPEEAHHHQWKGFLTMPQGLVGRAFSSIWKGKHISYEVSAATADAVELIKDEFLLAFANAAVGGEDGLRH